MQKLLPLMFLIATAVFAQAENTSPQQNTKPPCTPKDRTDKKNSMSPLNTCEEMSYIASLNKKHYEDAEVTYTIDRKVTCVAKGGYTIDYASCNRVRLAYNSAMIAEQAMFAQQKIRITENNAQQSADVAAAQQSGNVQNAALEAVKNRNDQEAEMNREQAYTYSTAVLGLSGTLGVWKNKGSGAISRFCNGGSSDKKSSKSDGKSDATSKETSNNQPNSFLLDKFGYEGKADCVGIVTNNKNSLFSNNDARTTFWLLTAEMIRKAAEAAKRAGISSDISKKLDQAKVMDDQETDVMIGCDQRPDLPGCQGAHEHVAGDYAGNTMEFGGAGTGQSFDLGSNAAGDLTSPSGTSAPADSKKVADHASPFENLAKQAKGILDPAAEAKVSAGQNPGGGAGGGGGGVGGGGGGGGGAANKGKGGEEAKDPSGAKISGKYKAGSGGGFSGVQQSKDDDGNPLAGLFENKGASGGIEEDNSVGGDIDGASSGLFQKISKRYGQVQQDKRIQPQNLE